MQCIFKFKLFFANNYHDGNMYILFQDLHDLRLVIFQNFLSISMGFVLIDIIIIIMDWTA